SPGARIESGRLIQAPPLLTLGTASLDYAPVALLYDTKKIQRTWDTRSRHPEIALGLDLALLATAIEDKWTYQVSDRYFCRLPGWHKYHPQQGRRPAWPQGTPKLEEQELMERASGRTWTLTKK